MFGINSWELVIIVIVALLVIGPERLPEYVAKLRTGIRDLKRLAEGAKTQLRDQMGPEFDNVDWTAYDPRQYDPRRIVREALAEVWEDDDTQDSAGRHRSSSNGQGATAADRPAGTDVDGAGPDAPSAASPPSASGPTPRVHTPDYGAVHDPERPVPFDTDAT